MNFYTLASAIDEQNYMKAQCSYNSYGVKLLRLKTFPPKTIILDAIIHYALWSGYISYYLITNVKRNFTSRFPCHRGSYIKVDTVFFFNKFETRFEKKTIRDNNIKSFIEFFLFFFNITTKLMINYNRLMFSF